LMVDTNVSALMVIMTQSACQLTTDDDLRLCANPDGANNCYIWQWNL
jgi:hypothetical protein